MVVTAVILICACVVNIVQGLLFLVSHPMTKHSKKNASAEHCKKHAACVKQLENTKKSADLKIVLANASQNDEDGDLYSDEIAGLFQRSRQQHLNKRGDAHRHSK